MGESKIFEQLNSLEGENIRKARKIIDNVVEDDNEGISERYKRNAGEANKQ